VYTAKDRLEILKKLVVNVLEKNLQEYLADGKNTRMKIITALTATLPLVIACTIKCLFNLTSSEPCPLSSKNNECLRYYFYKAIK